MMVAASGPAALAPALYGLNGQVHWPTFFARTAVRSLILWPVVNFIGGIGGVRGVVTAIAGGSAYTAVELAWDASGALAAGTPLSVVGGPLYTNPDAPHPLPTMNGFGAPPDVIDTFSP